MDKLNALVESIKADPSEGEIEFRTETIWIDGTHSKTQIRGFTLEADEPMHLVGSNKAPSPVELVLASLGSCLAVGCSPITLQLGGIDVRSWI